MDQNYISNRSFSIIIFSKKIYIDIDKTNTYGARNRMETVFNYPTINHIIFNNLV